MNDYKEGMLAIFAIIVTVNLIVGSIGAWIMFFKWLAGH